MYYVRLRLNDASSSYNTQNPRNIPFGDDNRQKRKKDENEMNDRIGQRSVAICRNINSLARYKTDCKLLFEKNYLNVSKQSTK